MPSVQSSRHANSSWFRRSRGFTLIELATVLGLITAIMATGFYLFNQDNDSRMAADTLTEVSTINSSIHNLYGTTSGYPGLSTAYVAANGQLPSNIRNGSMIYDPYKGQITIAPNTLVATNDSYTLTIPDLTYGGCMLLGTADFGQAFRQITVNGNATLNRPLLPAEVSTECRKGTNSVVLTFI